MQSEPNLGNAINDLLAETDECYAHELVKAAIKFIAGQFSIGLLQPCDRCVDDNGVSRGVIVSDYAGTTTVDECPSCLGWTVVHSHIKM